MNIITISREFGSGGRELGKRLSDILGYDYYDREIISAIAEKRGLSESFVEKSLEGISTKKRPITFGRSFTYAISMGLESTKLLSEQTTLIKDIAKKGGNFVIVGRNADVILKEYNTFNIFVYADMEAKISRCIRRAEYGENLSPKEIEQNIKNIDKARKKTREIISGSEWGNIKNYDLAVNTTSWSIKELAPAIAEFAKGYFGREEK